MSDGICGGQRRGGVGGELGFSRWGQLLIVSRTRVNAR